MTNMAAEIKPVSSHYIPKNIVPERPILLARIDNINESIKAAKLCHGGEGIMTVSEDKYFRIWQRRDSGQYWPSVCHPLPSSPICLCFCEEKRKLFIGLENGTIMEFLVAGDYNSVQHVKDYLSHQSSVTGVVYARDSNWVISISKDKFLVYYCVLTGKRLGGHQCDSWCTALQFDNLSSHAFVGDYTGKIVMLKLEESGYQVITSLKRHEGSIRSLAWEPSERLLFSGSFDQSIIVWDIGGGKGVAYELQGHTGNVAALKYLRTTKKLTSGGEDDMVIFWNMSDSRIETPEWIDADSCQNCFRPFFWNFRAMLDQRQFGLRQHHCRKCGRALCDSCSNKRSNFPIMGFEFEVRLCDHCYESVAEAEKKSNAKYLEVKHSIVCLDVEESIGILLTVGHDRCMKIWDASLMLK